MASRNSTSEGEGDDPCFDLGQVAGGGLVDEVGFHFVFGFVGAEPHVSQGLEFFDAPSRQDQGVGGAATVLGSVTRGDLDALASISSPNADFVNVSATLDWPGCHSGSSRGKSCDYIQSSPLGMQDVSVRFLTSGAAVLRCITKLSGLVDRWGNVLPAQYTMLTFVSIEAGGKWSIDVAQNTDINTTISPIKPSTRGMY